MGVYIGLAILIIGLATLVATVICEEREIQILRSKLRMSLYNELLEVMELNKKLKEKIAELEKDEESIKDSLSQVATQLKDKKK